MGEFLFPLVCFGDGGKGAKSGGGLSGVNKSGIVSSRGDVIGVSKTATSKDAADIEGVKGSPGVQRGGGIAWAYFRHILQVYLGNVGCGDGVYFRWRCQGGGPWVFGGRRLRRGGAEVFGWRLSQD